MENNIRSKDLLVGLAYATFYHDGAVRGLRIPFFGNKRAHLPWRLIENPYIVGAQYTGKGTEYRFYFHVSFYILKMHTFGNFLDIHDAV